MATVKVPPAYNHVDGLFDLFKSKLTQRHRGLPQLLQQPTAAVRCTWLLDCSKLRAGHNHALPHRSFEQHPHRG